ncbi:hypothetical protein HYC85_011921 [Camellia sinensis]|uniref:Uncharacterized protein n=1 Tax=Camellia sinensis TaxID=4442 RepID=A0A7J7HDH2_CAMSI|nr:hypothetical protein HYC85_011921 [Camellia sinensis]
MVGIFSRLSLYMRSHPATSLLLLDKKETLIPAVVDESRETRNRGSMDLCQNGVECNTEFGPVEHPIEPPDEDQPVKCPMPDSSVMNDGRMQEERFCDSLWKRTDLSAVMNKEGMVVVAAEPPPARAVRKRHHTSTQGDHTLTPLLRMPPPQPLPTQNITIFQMLQQQFNKFES